MSKVDVVRIRQQRGAVLANLNLFYPQPVRVDSLYRTVCYDPTYAKGSYHKDIEYFVAKGYVRYVDQAIGGENHWDHKVIVLTAVGKEVAEGTRRDEALEI